MQAHIFIDDSEFKRLAALFNDGTNLFRKASMAALRRVGRSMRSNLGKKMRAVSYLKASELTGSIGRLETSQGGMEVSVKVSGRKKAAYKFKMSPNRITARKGQKSINWPSPGVSIGPGSGIKHPSYSGYSKPFIANINGVKAMYVRNKASGELAMPKLVSPQYFSVYEQVQIPVIEEAANTFKKRLEHEIDYRLGLGR